MEINIGTTYRFDIPAWLAKDKGFLTGFVAVPLAKTNKAVYLFGHGTTDDNVTCIRCGLELTHPISRVLGIGPECGKHYYGLTLTEAHREQLAQMIRDTKVEGWFPLSYLDVKETQEVVASPKEHPVVQEWEARQAAGPEPKKAVRVQDKIVITFPYDATTLAKVKLIPGRKFSTTPKPHWFAPISVAAIDILRAEGFEIAPELMAAMPGYKASPDISPLNPIQEVEEVPVDFSRMNGTPYPFQQEGIKWLRDHGGCGLVADEMGLGKTLQAVGFLATHPKARPAVVVVPASLKYNWEREVHKWLKKKERVVVLSGRKSGHALPKADIYIINYDILADKDSDGKTVCRSDIKALFPAVVILDECHAIKNTKAQRTKAVQDLAKVPTVKHRIALSGTPIVNRPVEFFNALHFVAPFQFDHFFRFAKRYCGAVQTRFGWDFTGATNTQELHELLTKTCMLRRVKSEVLKELPQKVRTVVPLDITNKKEYDRAASDLLGWLKDKGADQKKLEAAQRAEILVQMEALKQLAVRGKVGAVVDWVHDFLENEEKLVVFTTHQWSLDLLRDELAPYNPVVVDGRVGAQERQAAVDTFQKDPSCRVFIGNLKAAGVGLTLTKASSTCFVELGWTAPEHMQAEDRVHRIGQEADSVNAYYLIGQSTIEEDIVELLQSKAATVFSILDGKETSNADFLTSVMERLKN